MLRTFSHLANAAVFVSVAVLAWNLNPSRSATAQSAGQSSDHRFQRPTSQVASPIPGQNDRPVEQSTADPSKAAEVVPLATQSRATSAAPASALSPPSADPRSVATGLVPPPTLPPSAQSAERPMLPQFAPGLAERMSQPPAPQAVAPPIPTAQPETTANSPAKPASIATEKPTSGAVVAPIRRQRPSPAAASAAKRSGFAPSPSAVTTTVKTGRAQMASAQRKPIILAGRSSLGAGTNLGNGQQACKMGLRYDKNLVRCVPLASPNVPTPLKICSVTTKVVPVPKLSAPGPASPKR